MYLSDIANMEYYLENDCYCPGEIYDGTGFFFQIFKPDEECMMLIDGEYRGDKVTSVLCRDQILNFWIEDNKIVTAERYDATENNISEIKQLLTGRKLKAEFNEFEKGKTQKSLQEIMKVANAIIVN